jgi:uncharacterized membrane protein YkoI
MAMARGFQREALAYFFVNKQDVKLEQAIEKLDAENKGTVVSARVRLDDDQWLYCLKRLYEGNVEEYFIDPKTGEIVETDSEWFTRYDDDEYIAAIANTKITILGAMGIANQQMSGSIIAARFVSWYEQSAYQIDIVSDQVLYTVFVDAESGNTIKFEDRYGKDTRRFRRHH